MNFRDGLSSLFWLIISVFICVYSVTIDVGTFNNPGPGSLPFLAGSVLGMLSIALLVASIWRVRRKETISSLWKGMEWHKVILVISFLFIYAILLSMIGYLITTFGLLFFLFCIMRRQKLWVPLVSAFFTTLLTYLIFCIWLGVQLPHGILRF